MLKHLTKDERILLFIVVLIAVFLYAKSYIEGNILHQYYVKGIGNLEGITVTGDSVVYYGNDSRIYVTGTSVEDDEWYKVLFVVVYDRNISYVVTKDISPNYCCKPKKYLSLRFTKPSPGIHRVTIYIIAGEDGKVRSKRYTICGTEYVLSKYEYYLWRHLPCDYIIEDRKYDIEYRVRKSLEVKSENVAESFYEAFNSRVYKTKLSYSFYVIGKTEKPEEKPENRTEGNYTKPLPYPTPSPVPSNVTLAIVAIAIVVGIVLLKII